MGMEEKYFIKDEALKSVDGDYFGHEDIANNIYRMIAYTEAPFNVAIIGKWGMGKSSLINIVRRRLENDSKNRYLVQEINAWKYQKEEFGKAFLKQLLQSIKGNEFTSQAQFENFFQTYIEKTVTKLEEKNTGNWFQQTLAQVRHFIKNNMIIVFFFVLTFLAVMGYKALAMNYCLWGDFGTILRDALLCYCKNVVTILIVPLMVWYGKLYMDKKIKQESIHLGVNIPLETRDDYECYLKNILKNDKMKNKKIVTIIDDLDRLDINGIVEALDALKVFMNLDNCIFIVPFDDAILKKALDKNRVRPLNSEESTIDSELILDKLFQYKVYIPELVKINIGKYAVELFKSQCSDFIRDYMNNDVDEACRIVQNVIIHKHVTTPRQVKKLLNNFVNNMIIAADRERKGLIQEKFATDVKSIRYIAKMSVLQADYNEFFDMMYTDMEIGEKLLEVYRGDLSTDIPQELIMFFEEKKEDELPCLKDKYQSLVDYLIFTENYIYVSAKASYLYMAQDNISVLTGDKKQQEFIASLLSWNDVAVRENLRLTPIMAEKLTEYLRMEDDVEQLMIICVMSINVIDDVALDYREELIRQIASRITTCVMYASKTWIEHLNIDNYYWVRANFEDSTVFDEALCNALQRVDYDEVVQQVIRDLLKHRDLFTNQVEQQVKVSIDAYVTEGEYGLQDADEVTKELSISELQKFFSKEFFKHLAEQVLAVKDYSDAVAISFARYFKAYVNEKNIVEQKDLLLHLITDMDAHGVLCEALRQSGLLTEIPQELGKELINELVANDVNRCSTDTYALLSNIPCVYEDDDEDAIASFDKFVSEIDSDEVIGNIVLHFMAEGNNGSLFTQTFVDLTDSVIESKERWNLFEKVYNFYSESEKDRFLKLLARNVVYESGKKYTQEEFVLKQLWQKKIWLTDVVSLVENTVYAHTAGAGGSYLNYISFVTEIVAAMKEGLTQLALDSFAEIFLKQYNSFPQKIVLAFNNIGGLLSDEILLKAIHEFTKSPSENDVDEIAEFLYAHSNMFSKENQNISDLVDFVIAKWELISDKETALLKLVKTYDGLGTTALQEISEKIISDDELVEFIKEQFAKFYNKLDDFELTRLMVRLSQTATVREMKRLLFSEKSSRSFEHAMNYAGRNAESYTNTELEVLLDIAEACSFTNINAWIQICKAFLVDNTDEDNHLEILNQIVKSVNADQMDKNSAVDILLYIYNNTVSDIIQQNVVKVVSEIKVTRKFKGKLDDMQKREFEKLQVKEKAFEKQ